MHFKIKNNLNQNGKYMYNFYKKFVIDIELLMEWLRNVAHVLVLVRTEEF